MCLVYLFTSDHGSYYIKVMLSAIETQRWPIEAISIKGHVRVDEALVGVCMYKAHALTNPFSGSDSVPDFASQARTKNGNVTDNFGMRGRL